MKIFITAAAFVILAAPAAATAQETAPDGTPAFGVEPYLGIQGGYHDFDSDEVGKLTIGCAPQSGCPDSGLVEAFAGVNVPLGPVFVGVEGNLARGFRGIHWEYGVYGRAGVRAGDSGMIYGKFGRQWVETRERGKDDNWSYGGGVEVGPKDIGLGGLTSNAGVRLRFEATTYDLKSIRPVAGVVFHF